jgi:hypothetical protein
MKVIISPRSAASVKNEWSYSSTAPPTPICLYGVVSDSCLLYTAEEEHSKYCQLGVEMHFFSQSPALNISPSEQKNQICWKALHPCGRYCHIEIKQRKIQIYKQTSIMEIQCAFFFEWWFSVLLLCIFSFRIHFFHVKVNLCMSYKNFHYMEILCKCKQMFVNQQRLTKFVTLHAYSK